MVSRIRLIYFEMTASLFCLPSKNGEKYVLTFMILSKVREFMVREEEAPCTGYKAVC